MYLNTVIYVIMKVRIKELADVPEHEAVGIYLEFKSVNSALKGEHTFLLNKCIICLLPLALIHYNVNTLLHNYIQYNININTFYDCHCQSIDVIYENNFIVQSFIIY